MQIANIIRTMGGRLKTPCYRWFLMWGLLMLTSVLAVQFEGPMMPSSPNALHHKAGRGGDMLARVQHIISEESRSLSHAMQYNIARSIITLSKEYDISPFMLLAIIKVESSFRPEVVSYAGAIGLMQVMPIAAREIADELPIRVRPTRTVLKQPLTNLQVGVHYLSFLRESFGANNWHHVLAAYNMGPTLVHRLLRRSRQPSKRYYAKVMRAYREYRRSAPMQEI